MTLYDQMEKERENILLAQRYAQQAQHDHKMQRAKEAGEGWMGAVFAYGIIFAIGCGIAALFA